MSRFVAPQDRIRCPSGHRYSVENTYKHPDGSRVCIACRNASNRRWRLRHLEQERIRCCQKTRLWYANNRERTLNQKKNHYQRLMGEFYDHYGRRCACCGETEQAFLSMDHIHGDGNQHRRRLASNSSKVSYRDISTGRIVLDLKRRGWPTDEIQVLCMNCNHAKSRLGRCPHDQNSWVVGY